MVENIFFFSFPVKVSPILKIPKTINKKIKRKIRVTFSVSFSYPILTIQCWTRGLQSPGKLDFQEGTTYRQTLRLNDTLWDLKKKSILEFSFKPVFFFIFHIYGRAQPCRGKLVSGKTIRLQYSGCPWVI